MGYSWKLINNASFTFHIHINVFLSIFSHPEENKSYLALNFLTDKEIQAFLKFKVSVDPHLHHRIISAQYFQESGLSIKHMK